MKLQGRKCYLIFTASLTMRDRKPLWTDEKMEAQKGENSCLRSQSW